MRALILAAAVVLASVALAAQQPGTPAPGAAQIPACPASGRMPQAYYALFGQNGGDGNTAYEIASPCIGKDVREVAESLGMGRNKLLGVKNVIGIMFDADGTMTGAGGTDRLTKAGFHMAYYLPAMRMLLNGMRANGQPLKEIRVFAGDYAWNETEEGRGASAAMNALNDRAPLLKLTPFGAMWSVIEAEGRTVVTRVNGNTVLTGTSPHDNIEVAVTIQDQHQKLGPYAAEETIRLPVAVTARANGHVYSATFAEYRDDWEPNVWMVFPKRLTWRIDGKPLADLTVTYFRSNPYIVFPVPDVVKRK